MREFLIQDTQGDFFFFFWGGGGALPNDVPQALLTPHILNPNIIHGYRTRLLDTRAIAWSRVALQLVWALRFGSVELWFRV